MRAWCSWLTRWIDDAAVLGPCPDTCAPAALTPSPGPGPSTVPSLREFILDGRAELEYLVERDDYAAVRAPPAALATVLYHTVAHAAELIGATKTAVCFDVPGLCEVRPPLAPAAAAAVAAEAEAARALGTPLCAAAGATWPECVRRHPATATALAPVEWQLRRLVTHRLLELARTSDLPPTLARFRVVAGLWMPDVPAALGALRAQARAQGGAGVAHADLELSLAHWTFQHVCTMEVSRGPPPARMGEPHLVGGSSRERAHPPVRDCALRHCLHRVVPAPNHGFWLQSRSPDALLAALLHVRRVGVERFAAAPGAFVLDVPGLCRADVPALWRALQQRLLAAFGPERAPTPDTFVALVLLPHAHSLAGPREASVATVWRAFLSFAGGCTDARLLTSTQPRFVLRNAHWPSAADCFSLRSGSGSKSALVNAADALAFLQWVGQQAVEEAAGRAWPLRTHATLDVLHERAFVEATRQRAAPHVPPAASELETRRRYNRAYFLLAYYSSSGSGGRSKDDEAPRLRTLDDGCYAVPLAHPNTAALARANLQADLRTLPGDGDGDGTLVIRNFVDAIFAGH